MRFLCDAMLGKLARDLRLLGYDTAYALSTETDDAVLSRARAQARLLITRDKALAARAGRDAILVREADPLDELVRALDLHPRAEEMLSRCTECGERLVPARAEDAPRDARDPTKCPACGHVYWEGSHTAAIRARLDRYHK